MGELILRVRADRFGWLFRRGWILQEAICCEIAGLEQLCLLGRPAAERAARVRGIARLEAEHAAVLCEINVLTARIRGRN